MQASDRKRAARILCLLMVVLTPLAARAADFSGDWQTFWRTGSAVLSLSQEGTHVAGSYQPDDGTIEGAVEGSVLRGTWEQPGSSGAFVFALSEDGQVLTGRFGNGEYWNGFRVDAEGGSGDWRLGNATPRETLRSLLIAANVATYESDAGALRQVSNLVTFAGPPTNAGDRAARRTMMFDILDMSTLRIMDVPEAPEEAGSDRVRFPIGPAALTDTAEVEFQRDASGSWRLVLPEQEALAAVRTRFLAGMGHDSMAELNRARANSPRAVMREFILGANSWEEGGRARALAVMDLSHIPDRLHELEGPIYADFLQRVLDRIAYVIWQEIPDDPDRSVPFIYFQHPVGNITIARVAEPASEDGGVAPPERWKIASTTLAAAPALLEAMQDLPVISGLEAPQALSPYFRLREHVRAAAPGLVVDWGYLELWQWLGLATAFVAAFAAVVLVGVLQRGLSHLSAGAARLAPLALPAGLLAASVIVSWAVLRLGLTQIGLPAVSTLAGLFVVVALALLAYRLTTLLGGWFLARAEKTTSYVDEIATSLGTGLVKLLIVVGAVIAAADVVGLPYEGVLTGLGVGGVALAFAARDTVSNLLGGCILMADRPFQRGDLIELDGTLATVEQVGLRSTRLRSLDDTVLNVPNAQLSDRTIANWGKRRRRKVVLGIGLTYDTSREKLDEFVKRLRDVLLDQPRIDREDLYVGLKGFASSSIDIEVMCFLRVFAYGSQVEAQHALILDIVSLAEEIGVEFAFPTRTVHMAGVGESPYVLPSQPRSAEAVNAWTTPVAEGNR